MPHRFAILARHAETGESWRSTARRAEELGYSTMLVPDHLRDHWPPMVAMTIAAEATSSLKVGTLVCNNDWRHPLVLAKEVAALDLAAEGRVEFGLGAGWQKEEYEQAGVPFDPPGTRITRLAESIQIMKQAWSGGTVRVAGEHYTVNAELGTPRPYSTPRPSLTIGGGGKRVLSLAAREADIIGFNASMRAAGGAQDADSAQSQIAKGITAQAFAERVRWVTEAAGERRDALEFQCMVIVCQVVADRPAMIDAIAKVAPLTAEEIAESPAFLIGSVPEICDQLEKRRTEFGFSYWVIPRADMETFAPVVEQLA
jgi:probable F420-dependent oxidoreductase